VVRRSSRRHHQPGFALVQGGPAALPWSMAFHGMAWNGSAGLPLALTADASRSRFLVVGMFLVVAVVSAA